MVRTAFNIASMSGLVDALIRFGDQLDKPPRRFKSLEPVRKNARMTEAADPRILYTMDAQVCGMMLFGLAFRDGETDCALHKRADRPDPKYFEAAPPRPPERGEPKGFDQPALVPREVQNSFKASRPQSVVVASSGSSSGQSERAVGRRSGATRTRRE
jgi:hypothetical protein